MGKIKEGTKVRIWKGHNAGLVGHVVDKKSLEYVDLYLIKFLDGSTEYLIEGDFEEIKDE